MRTIFSVYFRTMKTLLVIVIVIWQSILIVLPEQATVSRSENNRSKSVSFTKNSNSVKEIIFRKNDRKDLVSLKIGKDNKWLLFDFPISVYYQEFLLLSYQKYKKFILVKKYFLRQSYKRGPPKNFSYKLS